MATSTFYTIEQIGPKQSFTPEGFLLCEDVPVARTGMMIYGPNETPVEAGPDGLVKIHREDADVFRPETIASAQGKSVTNDHPDDDVTPNLWKELSHGIMLNVRRGVGAFDDLLLADLLITTEDGIKAVQEGKREVSLGYEADYVQLAPGIGKQTNIIINHVALVEQGRCGPRCAIKDEKPEISKTEVIMKTRKTRSIHDKLASLLRRSFKAKDEAELEDVIQDAAELEIGAVSGDEEFEPPVEKEDEDIHIHVDGQDDGEDFRTNDDELWEQNAAEHAALWEAIHELRAQLGGGVEDSDPDLDINEQSSEQAMLDEVPEGLEEEAAKAQDSRYLGESYRDTVALAEILVPGIQQPTFDSATKPMQTFKKICGFRRKALDLAYKDSTSKPILDDLLLGKPMNTKNMTCDAVRTLFNSAAATKRRMNNSSGTRDSIQLPKSPKPLTLAELNARNREKYAVK
jgi:hypothetical protein